MAPSLDLLVSFACSPLPALAKVAVPAPVVVDNLTHLGIVCVHLRFCVCVRVRVRACVRVLAWVA